MFSGCGRSLSFAIFRPTSTFLHKPPVSRLGADRGGQWRSEQHQALSSNHFAPRRRAPETLKRCSSLAVLSLKPHESRHQAIKSIERRTSHNSRNTLSLLHFLWTLPPPASSPEPMLPSSVPLSTVNLVKIHRHARSPLRLLAFLSYIWFEVEN